MVLVPSHVQGGGWDWRTGRDMPINPENESDVMHGTPLSEDKIGDEEALLHRYQRELRPSLGGRWGTCSLTKYGFIMNDGQYAFFDTQTCYGSLRENYNLVRKLNKTGFKYLIDWTTSYRVINRNWAYKGKLLEHDYAYIDWVINRSPWADIFIYKDAKAVGKQGNLIDMTKWPSRWVIGGTASVRHVAEYPSFSERWSQLKAHMPEIEAYFFAHLWHRMSSDKRSKYYDLWYPETTEGHTPIMAHTFTAEGVVNLFNESPVYLHENLKPFSKTVAYNGRDKYWYKAGRPDLRMPQLRNSQKLRKAVMGSPAYKMGASTSWNDPYQDGYTFEQVLNACQWYKWEALSKWEEFQIKEDTE